MLDTHALVWLTNGGPALGAAAREAADNGLADGTLTVSAISFWEIAMLERKGRVVVHQPLPAWRADLLAAGLVELPISGEVGIHAAQLEDLHPDPADRLIVATASLRRAELVTADERILAWRGPLRTRDARR